MDFGLFDDEVNEKAETIQTSHKAKIQPGMQSNIMSKTGPDWCFVVFKDYSAIAIPISHIEIQFKVLL